MMLKTLLMTFLTVGALYAQKLPEMKPKGDVKMGLNRVEKGYDYQDVPFPKDLMVFKMDKSKHTLKIKGLTLVQIWTMRDGTRPDLWNGVQTIASKYKDQGLTTYSVNFENGSDFQTQQQQLATFFKSVPQPENFYFDAIGSVTDLLKVPGFPTYYLVDAKGKIVFRTLGEDEEGVVVLEEEIRSRLAKKT